MVQKGKKIVVSAIIILLAVILFIPLPESDPQYSRALYAFDGTLISANVSGDHQWRLPVTEPLPDILKTIIITYEDEYYYYHLGVNPISVIKAAVTDVRHRSIKRGASTITMQVMRMKNKHAQRNIINKVLEMLAATKYSLFHSKKSILEEWANIAPFGGNTIGIQTASLRYFGRNIGDLSIAEYTLLAILPNNPSYLHLTKNRDILKKKRNTLLEKLFNRQIISKSDFENSIAEDLPQLLHEIPQIGYHFLDYLSKTHPSQYIFRSTIDPIIQLNTFEVLLSESEELWQDGINNTSAIVIDVENNTLLSYIGNIPNQNGKFSYVDINQSPRSYGSLLKPLLYAYALEKGYFLSEELVADIPTNIGDFQPMNFDKKFRGAVPLSQMVTQSLNVPAVRTLNYIGLQEFYHFLKTIQLDYLDKGADHYGLSLILGGGETNLWSLARMYKGLAQSTLGYINAFGSVQYLMDQKTESSDTKISSHTMKFVNDAMSDLSRPREEKFWDMYEHGQKIAWKTGTSFGHKDAWAIGYNAKYLVAVWVGNESGEGRSHLTGVSKAAPILFKIFHDLNKNQWFSYNGQKPSRWVKVCQESGKLAGTLCKYTSIAFVKSESHRYQTCTYHEDILLNNNQLRINSACGENDARRDTVFILPAIMEYYYRSAHKEYVGLPSLDPKCGEESVAAQIIYPVEGVKIFLPVEKDNEANILIARAYHPNENELLFWYLDDQFLEKTSAEHTHELKIKIPKGMHRLMVIDSKGQKSEVNFEVI